MIRGYWFFCLFLGLGFTSCDPTHRNVENLLIKGSDTEVNLALSLAETYMMRDPNVSIAVTGGGSGAGIAALINGKTNIANSSRAMKEEEIALASERQVNPMAIVVGMDAIAIIVHKDCPINDLSKQQLGDIYRGDISTWKALNWDDAEISLYGRQSNSGTFVYFRDSIVQAEYSQQVKQMNGTAQIVEAIKNDVHGIGYVGVGYIMEKSGELNNDLKVLSIRATSNGPAYLPTDPQNINSGKYPMVRPLFQYTNGKPSGKLRQFLRFCLSPEGQKLVNENGYFPVSSNFTTLNDQVLNSKHATNQAAH